MTDEEIKKIKEIEEYIQSIWGGNRRLKEKVLDGGGISGQIFGQKFYDDDFSFHKFKKLIKMIKFLYLTEKEKVEYEAEEIMSNL